jgi:hypothetical protein
MTDPISVAGLVLSLTTKATEALNALRERAQRTKDIEIRNEIATLYDTVLELKEVLSRLSDENKELKRKLEEQQHPPEEPKLKQVGSTNYYFKGDEGPFCQPCYDVDPKQKRLVALSPSFHDADLQITSRSCPVCHQTFFERIGRSRSSGPPIGGVGII